jgi:ornithine cyclodeaminase/alanine dehydrogenase-like protein (mu-crystallin family)
VTLHLTEADVRALLTMPLALEAVEDISAKQASGEAVLHARRRIELPGGGFFHYMAAADMAAGFLGMKLYTFVRGRLRFLVPLYRIATGDLEALIEADYMGQMRTGAASGVATKYMARKGARIAGVIGTGLQARTQLEAVAAVRKLDEAHAYSRNSDRLAQFCKDMSEKLQIPVRPAASADLTVQQADIVITATTAGHPVCHGAALAEGAHINAIGANFPHKRELDDEAIRRVGTIVVDSIEQSKAEAGDLVVPFGASGARWDSVKELADIVAGKVQGRRSENEITLFKSNGIAVWDVAAALRVYRLALEKGMGRQIRLWED